MKVIEKTDLLKQSFSVMEKAINSAEMELRKTDPSIHVISFHFGKIYETYRSITNLLNIFKD